MDPRAARGFKFSKHMLIYGIDPGTDVPVYIDPFFYQTVTNIQNPFLVNSKRIVINEYIFDSDLFAAYHLFDDVFNRPRPEAFAEMGSVAEGTFIRAAP